MSDSLIRTPINLLNYEQNFNQFYIKRDDLLPFSFGGNKVRIAEEYFNDMENKGYDCIISYGSSKSNLNRVIANMSKAKNIPCFVISPEEMDKDKEEQTFNSIIVESTGVNIVKCSKKNIANTIEKTISACCEEGLNPYYINGDKYGNGNKVTPVNAYIKAYEEILAYERISGIHFDYIFHASGTGMTQAGLICGKIINNDMKEIIGISIARNSDLGRLPIRESVESYFNNTILNNVDSQISFTDKYNCGGYGRYNNQIIEMIEQIFNYDGISLDLTYTGKAFWGMTQYIVEENIMNSKILFIHTGGTPLFFDDLSTKKLKESI
ncbi:1-aminocyclopropane-1-carboxylate deaminase/D-cysteine desulfhydrase [Enterococcus aquimarinus]|uniref:1-aminocyclopropane-1-carboxylate deaminase/D-cysteine desulfhydrase n=1 Tax=Enterococcus aquimarinus TaxID=328396 RepID=UPI0009004A2D|nr:pyridoxal-phosphate dependent enzyme [Enterococcus aquimarinus]